MMPRCPSPEGRREIKTFKRVLSNSPLGVGGSVLTRNLLEGVNVPISMGYRKYIDERILRFRCLATLQWFHFLQGMLK